MSPSASPNSSPPDSGTAPPKKSADEGIAEIREAAKAKRLGVDLSDIKLEPHRVWLRAQGKVADCAAYRKLVNALKDPPDCLYTLCRAEGQVLWNQVGWNGRWQDIAAGEGCYE